MMKTVAASVERVLTEIEDYLHSLIPTQKTYLVVLCLTCILYRCSRFFSFSDVFMVQIGFLTSFLFSSPPRDWKGHLESDSSHCTQLHDTILFIRTR